MQGEPEFVLCCPWDGKDTSMVVPGTLLRKCHECGCGIAVAPTSVKFEGDVLAVTLVCIPCGVKHLHAAQKAGEQAVIRTVPGAKEEAVAFLNGNTPEALRGELLDFINQFQEWKREDK
jgi:hypothetical protein